MSFNQHLGTTNSPEGLKKKTGSKDFVLARLSAIENSMRKKNYDAARMTLRRTITEVQRWQD